MIETNDIISRIKSDFKTEYNEVLELLHSSVEPYEFLNNNRIIRCLIYLSKGSLEELKHVIKQAKSDPRDVMLWAEYIGLKENEQLKRVRDFNKTFENCEKEVFE